ncbi:MAG: DUF1499 domain-containing protein [Desulfuromonadaceae bacterium]|nr:DUF1499 domain-containing protein [Desulfuromonadaceae bacterium]
MRTKIKGILLMSIGLLGLVGCAGERPNNLGAKGGLLTACPSSPNCVSSQVDDKKHRIAPLTFSGDPEAAFARLKLALGGRSDTTMVEEKPGYLRVELRTALFVDDGEFLLDRAQKVIHVRSASRLGYSDLGKNRSRMEAIRRQFIAKEANP